MWNKIASFILRNRAYILISLVIYLVALVYISMTYGVKFSTTSAQLLPSSDPAMVNLRDFQHTFGNESNVIVIGYDDEKMHEKPNYDAFKQLQQKNCHTQWCEIGFLDGRCNKTGTRYSERRI